MPQIVVDHPKYVERLTLSIPTRLELGTPFDLAVNTGSSDLPQLEVGQSSETGKQVALPVTILRREGQIVHLGVMPTFFGKTQFQVSAAYRDGGIAFRDFTATVNLPSIPPTEFHADALPFAGTRLDLNIPIRLQPPSLASRSIQN
jgi:hypothetical protein